MTEREVRLVCRGARLAFDVVRAYERVPSVFVTYNILEAGVKAQAGWSLTTVRELVAVTSWTAIGKRSLGLCRDAVRVLSGEDHVSIFVAALAVCDG